MPMLICYMYIETCIAIIDIRIGENGGISRIMSRYNQTFGSCLKANVNG